MWCSEDNSQSLLLSSPHALGIQTHIVSLNGKCLHPLGHHLTGLASLLVLILDPKQFFRSYRFSFIILNYGDIIFYSLMTYDFFSTMLAHIIIIK